MIFKRLFKNKINYFNYLKNLSPDPKGRYLKDIWEADDNFLEKTHDYIQYMFPTTQTSKYNPSAKISPDEIILLREDQEILNNLKISYQVYLNFLNRNINLFKQNDHNFKRISRILMCLKEFNLNTEAASFYEYLKTLKEKYPEKIDEKIFTYWTNNSKIKL